MQALKVVALSAILTLAAASAEAYPILQLDILGGHYDTATETILSDGLGLRLVALQDLQSHGVFPAFLREFAFAFSPTPSATGDTYFATFNVTTSLAGSSALHFDLYNTSVRVCGRNQGCLLDRDAALNAPFSHDAESTSHRVAEPQSLLLMSMGLLFAARSLSRLKKR